MKIRRRLAVPTLLALFATLLVSAPAGAQADDVRIATLGDSYASGNGARDYVGTPGCYQSQNAWPARWAAELTAAGTLATSVNAACSGAQTGDVAAQAASVAQADEVDVVALSIGGNDLGFGDIVADCFVLLLALFRCGERIESSSARFSPTLESTRRVLTDLSTDFPNAHTIVLVGYPDLNDPQCLLPQSGTVKALQADFENRQRALVESLDAAPPRDGLRFEFVSITETYADRGPCAIASILGDDAGRWVRQLGEGLTAEWFHPTALGHAATGALLASTDLHVARAELSEPEPEPEPQPESPEPEPQVPSEPEPVAVASAICLGLTATIVGTSGDDVLDGTPGDDVIFGGRGNDIIRGLGGNDLICGGAGDDTLHGGRGVDGLHGGAGDDELRGGQGADRIDGGRGMDVLVGGSGADRLHGGPGGRDRCTPEPIPTTSCER